jgi:hypothetical protein
MNLLLGMVDIKPGFAFIRSTRPSPVRETALPRSRSSTARPSYFKQQAYP